MPTPQYNSQVNPNYVNNIAPANPGQVNNYAGASLSQAGGTLSGLGAQAYEVGVDKQNQIDRQNAQIWASNAYSQAVVDWNQELNNRKLNLTGPGTDFAKTFSSDFSDYQNNLLQNTPNNATRNILNEQLNRLGTRLTTDAQDYQQKNFKDYQVNQIQNTIINSAKASAASQGATAQDSINNLSNTINAMPGLNQSQKFSLIDSMHDQMFNLTIDTMTLNNPKQAEQYIFPAVGKYAVGSVNNQIAMAARQYNVSPLVALSLMGSESGMSSTAQNPNSTAKGLLQFTDATWKDYGGTPENRNDPNTQIQLGMKYIADQQNSLQAILGHSPSPAELKAGVMFRSNAAAIIQASPDTPISSIIGDKTAALNNMTGKTTGQVMSSFNTLMSNQVKSLTGNDNYLVQTATAHQLFSAANKIQEALDKQAASNRFVFNQTVADHEAMAMKGQTPQTLLTQDAFLNMYPKDQAQGQAEYENYANTMKIGGYINQLSSMTPAQANQTYSSLSPQPNIPGYAQRIKDQELFATAMQYKASALQKDPVNYLQTNSSYINGLQNAMVNNPNDQNAKNNYFSALIGEQQKQNVLQPKIMSNEEENSVIQQIQNNTGMNRAQYLQGLQNQYGSFWNNAARQLQSNKDLPSGTTAMLSAPTPQAVDAASLASSMDLKQIKHAIPSDTKISDIDNEINKDMLPFYNSLDATQIDAKTVGDMRDTIDKLTYNAVRNGQSITDAAKANVNMFLGPDKYNYVNNLGSDTTLRIPKNFDQNKIQSNINNFTNNLTLDDINTSGAKLLRNSWTGEVNADSYLNQIKSNSIWQTNSNEDGAKLFFMGNNNIRYPVLDKSGNQIEKSFQNLSTQYYPSRIQNLKDNVSGSIKNSYIQDQQYYPSLNQPSPPTTSISDLIKMGNQNAIK